MVLLVWPPGGPIRAWAATLRRRRLLARRGGIAAGGGARAAAAGTEPGFLLPCRRPAYGQTCSKDAAPPDGEPVRAACFPPLRCGSGPPPAHPSSPPAPDCRPTCSRSPVTRFNPRVTALTLASVLWERRPVEAASDPLRWVWEGGAWLGTGPTRQRWGRQRRRSAPDVVHRPALPAASTASMRQALCSAVGGEGRGEEVHTLLGSSACPRLPRCCPSATGWGGGGGSGELGRRLWQALLGVRGAQLASSCIPAGFPCHRRLFFSGLVRR